uniref:Gametogenetin-binding protein 2 n=1 Tax=Eptatretus burgeri TaxID=7764 RepID=A0A8C4NE63_EPTBU
MARLVAVCRDGEEDFLFQERQIPLPIDENLTLVMEFPDNLMSAECTRVKQAHQKQFFKHYGLLSVSELVGATTIPSRDILNSLRDQLPCVGCRRSVECLYSALMESGNPALEPLVLAPNGLLSVYRSYVMDSRKLYSLFYLHGRKLGDLLDSIPMSKKNKRCPFHSLETHKSKPMGGSWTDIWDRMSQECRDEVVLIDSDCLLETLDTHLRKHRFCGECKTKVLHAYNILIGDADGSKEKGYCATLYEGLRACSNERHIHITCDAFFIGRLLGRTIAELHGGRRERHAKTLDSAQEEVVTCLAIHLYERLHRIWQRLRAEEQTWQLLFYLSLDALRKNFEVAVEAKQGISRMELLCEELSEEERVKELRQEKKRQKKKNRRKNKCAAENGNIKENGQVGEVDVANGPLEVNKPEDPLKATASTDASAEPAACSCPLLPDAPASPDGGGKEGGNSDCGYSSSVEGSEPSSQDGSESCLHGETIGIMDQDDDFLPTGPVCCSACLAKVTGRLAMDGSDATFTENLVTKAKKKKKRGKVQGSTIVESLQDNDATVKESGQGSNDEPQANEACSRYCASSSSSSSSSSSPQVVAARTETTLCRGKTTCRRQQGETVGSSVSSPSTVLLSKAVMGRGNKGSQMELFGKSGQETRKKGGKRGRQLKAAQQELEDNDSGKSLAEMLDNTDDFPGDEAFITNDEIRTFKASHRSFYTKRAQYRQELRERFDQYCTTNGDHEGCCHKWLAARVK